MLNRSVLILAAAIPVLTTGAVRAEKQSPAAGTRSARVDDFEDGDRRAASGLSWISIADDLRGGSSIAELSVTTPGAASRHALRVVGEVEEGGFAGAWVALDGRAQPTDATDFEGIRLRLRGNGAFQLGVRAGALPGFNYMAPVEAGRDWTQVSVPFAALQATTPGSPALDLRAVRWLGVSTRSGPTRPFELEVDDVELYASRDAAQLRVQSAPTLAVDFQASPASELPPGPCRQLAEDPPDDGKQKRLPDATALSVCSDDPHERVWFRVDLAGPLPRRWLGANIALDVDGDPANGMAWWGTNTAFHFDRLVSVYGSDTGSGYEGTFGIADASEVQAGSMSGSRGEPVLVVLDATRPAFVIGVPRSALGGLPRVPVRIVAAVGSALAHNDDVPNQGAALLNP